MALSPDLPASAAVLAEEPEASGFQVRVGSFDGPFDLLLTLIAKHQLDVTEIALSVITDEFLAYLRALDADDELDEASEFLVVAATLLDLKIAGLLPQGELVDAEDVALLEARDLLFARLLQYRAFKEAAQWLQETLGVEGERHYRAVKLEDRFRRAPSELVWTATVADLAALAAIALAPRALPEVSTAHLHAPRISIREQAATVVALLRTGETMTFRALTAGADSQGVVVARFLAVLELYRNEAVAFEQLVPLGELTVRWTAERWDDDRLADLGADYDD